MRDAPLVHRQCNGEERFMFRARGAHPPSNSYEGASKFAATRAEAGRSRHFRRIHMRQVIQIDGIGTDLPMAASAARSWPPA